MFWKKEQKKKKKTVEGGRVIEVRTRGEAVKGGRKIEIVYPQIISRRLG